MRFCKGFDEMFVRNLVETTGGLGGKTTDEAVDENLHSMT